MTSIVRLNGRIIDAVFHPETDSERKFNSIEDTVPPKDSDFVYGRKNFYLSRKLSKNFREEEARILQSNMSPGEKSASIQLLTQKTLSTAEEKLTKNQKKFNHEPTMRIFQEELLTISQSFGKLPN